MSNRDGISRALFWTVSGAQRVVSAAIEGMKPSPQLSAGRDGRPWGSHGHFLGRRAAVGDLRTG
jgi:hypothetical protein